KELLKDFVEPKPEPVDIQKIIDVVAEQFNLTKKELLSRKRSEALSLPRQFGMYLTKILTELSYSEISENFGRKDHTTAYHAYIKIKNLISSNPYYAQLVNQMIEKIKKK
ncbi:MAG: chromosomal replication initiator protein DnaA, partial [Endomicrobia bacterium]|nr:chromosomal replication initiator protein DnaA [Endomicrobiia bacterium]